MTLFDIEQYHQPKKENYKRDWGGASYDATWDEPEDIPPISQNEALINKEACLKEEEEGKCTPEEEYRWKPEHFGETPRKFDSNGNTTIFWDESIEPPLLEDFEPSQEYEESWQQWEKSSDNHSSVKERSGNYNTTTPNTLKAISLWQPWASLIELGLKHYETRSWKTKYRGRLLICSAAKSTKEQYQQYLKISNEIKLPLLDESNFPRGYALAICDLVDCIEMTPEFISQQSQTEILCGDWQIGRYAWKLENIQPITEPFAVKGKQGLFNVTSTSLEQYLKKSTSNPLPKKSKSKSSDSWYTPSHIFELVVQVLGTVDLDPCADDGKHLEAAKHYTIVDDGLIREWEGKVYINPPFSHPGVWMKKLQSEMESERVKEAIALIPAATDTKWLSPLLKSQPVCFWTGRIKFLNKDYQPKNSARQSHVLVYWGENWERFKDVFEPHGFVSIPSQSNGDNLDNKISPRKINKGDKFLGDKTKDRISSLETEQLEFLGDNLGENISPRKINKGDKFLGDKTKDRISSLETEQLEFLGDNLGENISPRKIDKGDKFLGDKTEDRISSLETQQLEFPGDNLVENISPRKIDKGDKFLGDKTEDRISPLETRRRKGNGSGSLHYRTVTKKGKEYHEAYYHYEFWKDGVRLVKSSKYIPKRLLSQVQRLEARKAPVKEILKILGL